MYSLSNSRGGGTRARVRALGRAVTLGAFVALLLLLIPAAAGVASAHIPSATLKCVEHQPVLAVDLEDYNASYTNTVAVSTDSVAVSGSPFTFVTKFNQTWTLVSATVAHTALVVVSAGDDPNGSHGWSKTYNLQVDACQKPAPTLKLVKVVAGTGAPDQATAWTLTATDPDGTPVVQGNGTAGPTEVSDGVLYTLAESGPTTDYIPGTWQCDGGRTGNTIRLKKGDAVTCTITNTYVPPPPGTLKVIKVTDYQHGGTLEPGDFTLHVMHDGTDVSGSPRAGSSTGTTYTLVPGTYVVSEDAPPAGYAQESTNCLKQQQEDAPAMTTGGTVTIQSGDQWLCTVTNTDVPATLIVIKQIDNQHGGTLGPSDFTLHVEYDGADVSGSPHAGSASGTTYTLDDGVYTVSEDSVSGYTLSNVSGDCAVDSQTGVASVTLAVGDKKSCTFTNTDEPAHLTLIKRVSGSGTAEPSAWTLSATGDGDSLSGPGPQVSGDVSAGTYTLSESGPQAGYTASGWSCDGGSLDGSSLSLQAGDSATCTITNSYSPPPSGQGSFQFTKTVGGNLTGWTGGQFPFTVTCGESSTPVTLTLGANGSTVSSPVFGPYDPGTTCSVTEGSLPAAGTYASWVSSPSYSPSNSAVIASDTTVIVAVTNTRTYTPPPPPVTPLTPKIAIAKVASPTHLGAGGGSVTYTYTVTNPGQTTLSTVTVTDDRCAPVTYVSGDANHDNQLETTEAWTYTCTATLTQTTTNTATATGYYNGLPVTATAQAVVTVAPPTPTATPTATPGGGVAGATGTPSLPPTTEIPGQGGGPNGTILLLLGALGAASLALIATTLLRERLLEYVDRR